MVIFPQVENFHTMNTCTHLVSFSKHAQIVGVVSEELDAAQKWNGPGMLDLLRKHPG